MKSLVPTCLKIILVYIVSTCMAHADIEIVAGPYLQYPTETEMTVMWVTNANSTAAVEYGTSDEPDQQAIAVHDGQIDANTTVHRVRIRGLNKATRYNYRVVSTEIENYGPYKVTFGQTIKSDIHHFQTPAADGPTCSFVVLNDLHDRINTLKAAIDIANQSPYDMVFLNGDIINDPKTEAQIIDNTLKPTSQLFAGQTPFWLVRGNHETRGAYARHLKNYFDLPQQRYYYTFKQGPIFFVILDTGEDKEDSHWAYSGLNAFDSYRDEQTVWLKEIIQRDDFKNAPFRVVLSHIPLFGYGKDHGAKDSQAKWAALLNEGKVDLHLSGHVHQPSVTPPAAGVHDYPVFIGGSPDIKGFTVIRVEATPEKLTVTMTDSNDKVINRNEINRR